MNIVHALGWYYPDSIGGTEVYVAGLARRLRAAGHEIAIAAPSARRSTTAEYQHEQISVFRYPVPGHPTRNEAQGLVPARGAQELHKWLQRQRPDVLHVHSMVTGLGVHELRAARDLGIPIVLTHHLPSLGVVCRQGALMERGTAACDGLASPRRCAACVLETRGAPTWAAGVVARMPMPLSDALGYLGGPLGTGLGMVASIGRDRDRFREVNQLVDVQVVLNEAGRRILAANGVAPSRISINRLGVDQLVSRKPDPDRQPTTLPIRLGYIGRIDSTKGLRELVLAMRRVPEGRLTLTIVGPFQSSVPAGFGEELARLAQTDSRISLLPAVPATEVPQLLSQFDLLCCPSTGFENGPTVALESMAVGTPVVGTTLGNLGEIVRDDVDGRLVPPHDVAALAEVFAGVAAAPDRTIDRWRAAIGPVRTMQQITADYLSLYSRLRPTAARAS